MFDYSQVTPRDFEKLAKEYLESTYQGSSWTLTESSGDGNRDVVCTYRFLDQEFEYWAEAKFSKAEHPAKLKKSQLDPTLVSALLYSKPVTVKFISNNLIPDTYIYRLTDFRLRTNIGVTLVLKDQFEEWIRNHLDIAASHGIRTADDGTGEATQERNHVKIQSLLVTSDCTQNTYVLERKLVQQQPYYLYLAADSDAPIENVSIRFLCPEFQFLSGSDVLNSPKCFSLTAGPCGYKFCFTAKSLYQGSVPLALYSGEQMLAQSELPELSVINPRERCLAYAQQDKCAAELGQLVAGAGNKNRVAVVSGRGASGKTYLMDVLLRNLSFRYETVRYSFSETASYNATQLCLLLLFLNIGNMEGYSYEDIGEAVSRLATPEKRLFLSELLTRISDAPEQCVEFMCLKQAQGTLRLIFPQRSRIRKVVVLEDLHKLNDPVKAVLLQLLREFSELENNQVIVCTMRGTMELGTIPDYSLCLKGLTSADKLTTLRSCMPCLPETILFHRATDDLLIFSNILRGLLDELETSAPDPLTLKAHIRQRFQNVKAENLQLFQEHLAEFRAYDELIELVFLVGTGIAYPCLSNLFPAGDIDLLIESRIFKLTGGKVAPIHDHYTAAFLKSRTICPGTLHKLQTLLESDNENCVFYLSLLIESGNAMFFSRLSEARAMRDRYFYQTRLYEAYLLAQAIVSHIDFSEQLSEDEVCDVFVLATSSFYQKSSDDEVKLYQKVLQQGKQYQSSPKIWGILLRSRTELMNQYYWDLKLEQMESELNEAQRTFPHGEPEQDHEIRFACIHRYNRRMVLRLLQNRYKEAEEDFQRCLRESERLIHPACRGYAEMDYGKGLYLHAPEQALEHMEKALDIFQELGTEHRRSLDCKCEVAYLRCLLSEGRPEDLHGLEDAAAELHNAHYEELYAKAKLKLAALHMCFRTRDLKQAENELVEAEYVLPYRPCRRLEMLLANVKYVHYILTGQRESAAHELKTHETLASGLGEDYLASAQGNLLNQFPVGAAFYAPNQVETMYALIDPRLW
ncbi:hypothetical protein [Flavonifractor sp. An306]|uniref:hypothetical protein n=1 Tax=Flavonifractor sp. An306 TaxID=1965629 RepID=UPI00111FFF83|nr:hypothetical protein [Flavonifractor sp. An306]